MKKLISRNASTAEQQAEVVVAGEVPKKASGTETESRISSRDEQVWRRAYSKWS